MRQTFLIISLFLCNFLQAQEDFLQSINSFLKDYEAALNNLSDPGLSLQERKLFREDILDIYFVREETKVFNHLNEEGTRFLNGEEYLENLLLDYNERIKHKLIVDEDIDFEIKSSTFTVPVTHIMKASSWQRESRLSFVIKWYNDSRPDILSILSGKEAVAQKKEEQKFLHAKNQNTVSGFLAYVEAYPDGEYIVEAKKQIQILEEEQAWLEAKEDNTIEAYQNYMDDYPKGKYLTIAEKKNEKMKEMVRYEALPASIQHLVDNMIPVEGGKFKMGCTSEQKNCFEDEFPISNIIIDSLQFGKYEVSQQQWKAVMGYNPSYFKGCDECPVEQVSWEEVQAFIKKLNDMTGENYRLPTESEWEYAARGGNESNSYIYAGSNDPRSVALFAGNSGYQLQAIPKAPNELGLHHMSGSVYEWCQNDYLRAEDQDEGLKVIRGGAWNSAKKYCRISNRFWMAAESKMDNIGFRLVKK